MTNQKSKMSTKLGIFLMIFSVCYAQGFYKDCGSKAKLVKVSVTNCKDDDDMCVLERGTNVTIDITFTNADTKNVAVEVCGVPNTILNNVCIPFPVESDGCKSGISCPVKSDQTNTYTSSVIITSQFPRVTGEIKWELKDDSDNDIACLLIMGRIE